MARNLWIALFDLHVPETHEPTLNAVRDFIKKNPKRIAGLVLGGDQADNAEISRFTAGKPLHRPPGIYKRNTEKLRAMVAEFDAILPKEAEKVWIIGNHDDREFQLTECQPELIGTVERPLLLNLKERGWEVVPLGEALKLGKLNVLHGEGLSGIGNQVSTYHAKKAVEMFCSSVLYGHFHTSQSYTKVLPHSTKDKWIGWCAPAACTLNPGYLKNRPTAWVNGFVLIELHEPEKVESGSNFNVYPVIISNGKFSYGGELYGGK